MSMGAFAMILLENALLPDEALVSDELKLVLALVAGAALWFVTTQAEHLIVQIFGAAAGMAAGSLVYNVAAHLALEHVHGYNGDCTPKGAARPTNAHWLRGGELVYPAAAAVVVLDPRTGRQRFFLGHSDYVSCVAPHPGGGVVASVGPLHGAPRASHGDANMLHRI